MTKNYIITLLFLLGSITTFSQTITAPTNFQGVETSPGKITFSWNDNSNNESGFYIEKLISTFNKWEKVCKVSSNITSTTCNAISNNIYRISAYRGLLVPTLPGGPFQSNYCQTCVGLLADLTVSNVTPSKTTVNSGESFTVSYVVNNIGTYKTLFETSVKIFISSTPTEPGILAGPEEYYPQIDAGLLEGTSISKSLTITAPIGNGRYHIMCIVGPSGYKQTPELSRSNNCGIFTIEIAGTDLTTSNVNLNSTTVDAGGTVNVSCLVNNIGVVNAPSSMLKYYISTTPTGRDQELGTYAIGSLAAGTSTSHNTTLSIPSTYGGSYYIVSMANADGSILEPTSNNFASKQITVTGKPYFQVTDITWDGTQSGSNITYNVTVKNIGTKSGIIPNSLINVKTKLDTDLDELSFFANYGLVDCVNWNNINATESIGINETKSFSQVGGVPGVSGSTYWVIPNIKNWDDKTSYVAKKFIVTSSKVFKEPLIERTKSEDLKFGLNVYPNPNNGQFSISLDNTAYTDVKVYNSTGQLVYHDKVKNQNLLELNLTNLPNGAYIINLLGDAKFESRKIVIQK